MADKPIKPNDGDILEPEDVSSAPSSASPSTPEKEKNADAAPPRDPADEIPVPVAMSPAEIDERAKAVEAVRGNRDPESGMKA